MSFTEVELLRIEDVIDLAIDHDFYGEHPDKDNIVEILESILDKIKRKGE